MESLLTTGEDSFLEKPPSAADSEGHETVDKSTSIRPPSPDTKAPNRIGTYRILREIGEGGMGVVYEAEQEKPVRRKVALKLIKWGMDTKAVVARFDSERQALALMSHPNIASVYDAGGTNEGRPYFSMELVHGEAVTEYCDKNRLTIRERLALFVQVCEGVQHAHQKGIIHRDIKPSNVLITIQDGKPVPKIIDFGVAKATSQRLTERTVYTELGQLVGTPEYMSPEQAEMTGIDIDTRTDVYSLGAVLYELLVGAQPLDGKTLRQTSFDDMRRKIREEEPPKPSTRAHNLGDTSTDSAKTRRVEPRVLARELQGDLDWITMKALEKDRTRRYGSPSDLAADIQRHLRHEPVLASPPSTLYRATKFMRRHLVGVASATVIALLLVALAVGMVVQTGRIANERDRAELEAAKARAVNAFMRDTLLAPDPDAGVGREVTVAEALGVAAAKLTLAFPGQPEVEANARSAIGWAYFQLGRYDEAEPLLEEALDIRRRTLGSEHPDLAESLDQWAQLEQVRAKYGPAESFYRQALAMRRSVLGPEHPGVATSLQHLAAMLVEVGRYEEAESALGEALAVQERLGDDTIDYANLQSEIGAVLWNQGKYEEVEPLWLEVLDRYVRLLGREHLRVGYAMNSLAVLYDNTGRRAEAERYYRDALAILEVVRGPEHEEVSAAMANLAILLDSTGKDEEAERLYREALRIDRKQLGSDHPAVANDLANLATLLCKHDQASEGLRAFDEAMAIFTTSLEPGNWRLGQTRQSRGECLASLGRYGEAESELSQGLAVLSAALAADHWRVVRSRERLAQLYEAWGKPEKAVEYRALLEEAHTTQQ